MQDMDPVLLKDLVAKPSKDATLRDALIRILDAWLRVAEAVPDVQSLDWLCVDCERHENPSAVPQWRDAVHLAITVGPVAHVIGDAELAELTERIGALDYSFAESRARAAAVLQKMIEDEEWRMRPWVNPTEIGERLEPRRPASQVNAALHHLGLQVSSQTGWLLTDTGSEYGEQAVARSGRHYIRWKHEIAELLQPEHFEPTLLLAGDVGIALTPPISAQQANRLLMSLGFQKKCGKYGWWLTDAGAPYGVQHGKKDDPQPKIRWRREVIAPAQAALAEFLKGKTDTVGA